MTDDNETTGTPLQQHMERIEAKYRALQVEKAENGVIKEGEGLMLALTAKDLADAWHAELHWLKVVDLGNGNTAIMNRSYMLRRLLQALGFREPDIRLAIGAAGMNEYSRHCDL